MKRAGRSGSWASGGRTARRGSPGQGNRDSVWDGAAGPAVLVGVSIEGMGLWEAESGEGAVRAAPYVFDMTGRMRVNDFEERASGRWQEGTYDGERSSRA